MADGRRSTGLQAGLAACVVFGLPALAIAVSVARAERTREPVNMLD